jgi:formimidoylglutamate deiminase
MSMTQSILASHALLPTGWAKDVRLQWNDAGQLTHVEPNIANAGATMGPLVPGTPNLHSHAFQRAIAGLTEYRGEASDSFWSWRTLMYRFALRLDPAQLEAIALGLYVEMLEAGYTSVCEFHYVHHQGDGRPYADDADAGARADARGATCGHRAHAAAGALPDERLRRHAAQRRAAPLHPLDRVDAAPARSDSSRCATRQGARLGLAPHSLRAVPPDALRDVLAGLDAIDPTAPVHIHIAEQTQEVDDCIAWSGQRPVAWLLDHAPVDARWCLVHATHMDAAEYRRAAAERRGGRPVPDHRGEPGRRHLRPARNGAQPVAHGASAPTATSA